MRIVQYSIRGGSGGGGYHRGGDGIRREIEFLVPTTVTLLCERRELAPFGLHGGEPGTRGRNVLIRRGRRLRLPSKVKLMAASHDHVVVSTPGGGGWGRRNRAKRRPHKAASVGSLPRG